MQGARRSFIRSADPPQTKDKQEAALKPPWQCAAECAKRHFSKSEVYPPSLLISLEITHLSLSLFIFFSLFPTISPSAASFVLLHCTHRKTFAAFFRASAFHSLTHFLRCPLLLVHPFLLSPNLLLFFVLVSHPCLSFFFPFRCRFLFLLCVTKPRLHFLPSAVVMSLISPSNADPLLCSSLLSLGPAGSFTPQRTRCCWRSTKACSPPPFRPSSPAEPPRFKRSWIIPSNEWRHVRRWPRLPTHMMHVYVDWLGDGLTFDWFPSCVFTNQCNYQLIMFSQSNPNWLQTKTWISDNLHISSTLRTREQSKKKDDEGFKF